MHTYLVYVQYQSLSCKHRCSDTLYVRAHCEEDALLHAKSIPSPEGYEIRRTNIMKEVQIFEVQYN